MLFSLKADNFDVKSRKKDIVAQTKKAILMEFSSF